MLLELDRELVTAHAMSPSRLVMDFAMAAYVVFEMTRRTPRLPGVAAVAMAALALRFVAFALRPCGHGVHVLVYAGAVLAAGAACAVVALVPNRARVVLELLDRMQITRSAAFAATAPREPGGALVGFVVAVGAALPGLLYVSRQAGLGLLAQGVVCVAYAVATPFLARKIAGEIVFRPPAPGPPARRVALGIGAGLALTFALLSSGRDFFQAGADLARCLGKLDTEAKRALEAQSSEIARSITRVRESTVLLVLTAAVFPFVEERVYRGLVQDVLVRKYGSSYGVFASAIVFGVAHYGIYEVALYQTVLLGIGFGIAYVEGGLLAAFTVHAAWNVAMLL
jgi:membrane protease YdiL (CAAX protease family)